MTVLVRVKRLLLLALAGALALHATDARADIDYDAFCDGVAQAVEDGTIELMKPVFRYSNTEVHYSLGGRVPTPRARVPLDYPQELRCTAEALWRYRSQDFWHGPIVAIRPVVKKQLRLISRHSGSREALMRELQRLSDRGYAILQDAVERHARETDRRAVKIAMAPRARRFPVTVTVQPAGAELLLLDEFTFRFLERSNLHEDSNNWAAVGVQPNGNTFTFETYGNIRVMARWARAGQSRMSSNYLVQQPTTIPTLRL